jgi:outer membrane protein assembly factor BamE (lipoprotein component of BamABCDE complex)
MTLHRRMVVALAAAALFSGCLNVGRDFPVAPVSQLEVGVTTRAEVRERFGEPWRTGVEDGQKTWTYGRYHYSLFGPAQTRDLVVRFDAQGRVASFAFNSTHPEDADL